MADDHPTPPEDDPSLPPEPIEPPKDDFESELEKQAAEELARADDSGKTTEYDVPMEGGFEAPIGDAEGTEGDDQAADEGAGDEGAGDEGAGDVPEDIASRKTIVIRPGTAAGRAAVGGPVDPADPAAKPADEAAEDGEEAAEPAVAAQTTESAAAAQAAPPDKAELDHGQLTPAEGGVPPGMIVPPTYAETQVSEEDIHRPRLWVKFLIASSVIFISFAAATSTTVLLYLQDIARKLGSDPALAGAVDILNSVDADQPQTILLVGSDRRFGDKSKGIPSRSDTVILLRLDPDRGAIATLRLPRDLKVKIPGGGTDKLNAAYALGGPTKTLETVKSYMDLEVNHIVNVSFRGFQEAVNAIDCVYIDVDRRYFHSNEGLPPSQQYAEIDLKQGYQKLCGQNALDFVRYRHEDNDLVRGVRQQEFLRQARQKIGPDRLLRDRQELLNIFTRNTSSDIDDGITMLEILKLFVASRRSPIREVNLGVKIGETYVTATPAGIARAKRQFLGIRGSVGPRGESAAPESTRIPAPKPKGKRKPRDPTSGASIYNATQAARLQRAEAQSKLAFPVYAPTRLERGSQFLDKPRTYDLNSPNKEKHRAYKMVMRTSQREYYGVMGTDWTNPPILNSPDGRLRLGGRTFLIYNGTENRPRMVAWKTRGAVYWISNTLRGALTRQEMLAIARSTRRIRG